SIDTSKSISAFCNESAVYTPAGPAPMIATRSGRCIVSDTKFPLFSTTNSNANLNYVNTVSPNPGLQLEIQRQATVAVSIRPTTLVAMARRNTLVFYPTYQGLVSKLLDRPWGPEDGMTADELSAQVQTSVAAGQLVTDSTTPQQLAPLALQEF